MYSVFRTVNLTQPHILIVAAALVAYLLNREVSFQSLAWMMVAFSSKNSQKKSTETGIGDSGGDVANPAGDPPPPGDEGG